MNNIDLIKEVMKDKKLFIKNFPELKAEVIELTSKPKCGICRRNFLAKMHTLKDKNERMSNMLLAEVGLEDLVPLLNPKQDRQPKIERVPNVRRMGIEAWDEFYVSLFENSNIQVTNIVTFYDPEKSELVVSYVELIRNK